MDANEIFGKIKRSDFLNLIEISKPYFKDSFDVDKLILSTEEFIKSHAKKEGVSPENIVKKLEIDWYKSLDKGTPDYSVYSSPSYLGDVWTCWVCYSRNSVKALASPTSLVDRSVLDYFGKVDTVVDLGCGFGFTTVALKALFPNAIVRGTNLESSYQFKVAKDITWPYGIEMIPNVKDIGNVDVIFASEYFEHFESPIEQLYEVYEATKPKHMVIANGFNGIATGHFKAYKRNGSDYTPSEMSALFNKAMRLLGYEKIKTKIWNGRPAIWTLKT